MVDQTRKTAWVECQRKLQGRRSTVRSKRHSSSAKQKREHGLTDVAEERGAIVPSRLWLECDSAEGKAQQYITRRLSCFAFNICTLHLGGWRTAAAQLLISHFAAQWRQQHVCILALHARLTNVTTVARKTHGDAEAQRTKKGWRPGERVSMELDPLSKQSAFVMTAGRDALFRRHTPG